MCPDGHGLSFWVCLGLGCKIEILVIVIVITSQEVLGTMYMYCFTVSHFYFFGNVVLRRFYRLKVEADCSLIDSCDGYLKRSR